MPPRGLFWLAPLALAGTLSGCMTSPDASSAADPGSGGKADGPGCDVTRYVDEARVTLAELDAFYRDVTWSDATARQEPIADLNGDGRADLIVVPGLSYAGANEEMVVYLSVDDAPCAMRFAGQAAGVDIAIAPDRVTAGHKDLRVSNTSACESEVRRHAYNPATERYEPTDDADTQKLCD